MNEMTIGSAAKAAGVKIDTIRYHQRIGLITETVLPQGGQLKYRKEVVRRVKFIQSAQTLGFTLDETSSLLSFGEAKNCCATKELPEHKIKAIDSRIAVLRRMKQALGDLTMRSESGVESGLCPIIDSLENA